MASEPTVCCVLLTRDRPQMAVRAVASFRAQTYQNACMLVFNTGRDLTGLDRFGRPSARKVVHWHRPECVGKTIGELRNLAIQAEADWWGFGSDIFAHFDDDDWSHPNRLAEQVALLQSSGADLVGYNEALFWDTRRIPIRDLDAVVGRTCDTGFSRPNPGQAWLYRNQAPPNYVLGSSMLYWRKTWKAHPFDAISHGEDERFRVKCGKVAAVSSIVLRPFVQESRLICSIHGGNTSPFDPARSPAMCKRAPEWDSYCERVMSLEVRA
jgi:hypothetical protein